MNLEITSYCKISNTEVKLNHKLFCNNQNKEESFTKTIYKALDIKYPKFYKMDILSKYGFLASELLIQQNGNINSYKDNEIALLLANSNSCQATDLKYQESINREKPSPSPSLFVYTLPNIVLGEIAIRNKWYGDNMFYIFPNFNSDTILQYIKCVFSNANTKACIIGWLNIIDGKNDVFLFCVEHEARNKSNFKLELNSKNINNLYKN